MNLREDLRMLWNLLRGQPLVDNHPERLDRFYGPQASHYDAFRQRLLHGREELLLMLGKQLPEQGGRLVELGSGTGFNLTYFGERINRLESVELVDICTPLLDQARKRWAGFNQVNIQRADATTFQPAQPVDIVYFSYALTMIPDWYLAIDNAIHMLRTGGVLGVVDFYVSRPYPEPGSMRHGKVARHFWPLWFGHDGVCPSPDHLPYLKSRLQPLHISEQRAQIPYLPGLRAPYYQFVGRKS